MSKTKKTITVRRQKIKKNHVREKLIFFTILVLILLVIAAFARKLCPYDPDMQDLLLAQKPPSAEHIHGVELHKFDVLQLQTGGQGQGHAVAGQIPGRAVLPVAPPATAASLAWSQGRAFASLTSARWLAHSDSSILFASSYFGTSVVS